MISLYASGSANIEVGKYTMTMEEAKEAFLKVCKQFNLTPKKNVKANKIVFSFSPTDINITFSELRKRLINLLTEIAYFGDLHGDAPDTYMLKSGEDYLPNSYIRTGTYAD